MSIVWLNLSLFELILFVMYSWMCKRFNPLIWYKMRANAHTQTHTTLSNMMTNWIFEWCLLSIITNLIKFIHSHNIVCQLQLLLLNLLKFYLKKKMLSIVSSKSSVHSRTHQHINLICELSVSLSIFIYYIFSSFMWKWIREKEKEEEKKMRADERTRERTEYISYSLLFAATFLIISFIVCVSRVYLYVHMQYDTYWYRHEHSAINKSLASMHQFNDDDDDDYISILMTSTEKFISLCRWIGTILLLFHVSIILMQSKHTNIDTKCTYIYCLFIRQCKQNTKLFYRYAIQFGFCINLYW